MKSYILIFVILFGVIMPSFSDNTDNKTERVEIRNGNKTYESKEYVKSEINYRKALESNPSSLNASYNLGNSLYRQGRYLEAANSYEKVARVEADDIKASDAWYNLGNSYFKEYENDKTKGEYLTNSIDAYKDALRRNPKNDDARHNLRVAQLLLKQSENQSQNQPQNQHQDQEKQDQQSQQEQEEQKKQEEQQQIILEAIRQKEKATQEKINENLIKQREKKRSEKEW